LPRQQMHPIASLAKFVRSGGLPGSADIKTYDVGNLNVATQGIPSNTEVGELRVRYTCVFTVPVLESTVSAPANNQVALFQSLGPENVATGTNFTLAVASAIFNGIGAVNVAGLITLPPGNYLVDSNVQLTPTGGLCTVLSATMNKNAGAVAAAIEQFDAAAVWAQCPMSIDSYFVSSNGTDSVSLRIGNGTTFTGGAGVVTGTIRIVAI